LKIWRSLWRRQADSSEAEFLAAINDLKRRLFDPNFEPTITAKNPQGGLDILQASSNNFYSGVKLADVKRLSRALSA